LPTSGTSSFNYTRDQIIKAAFRKIGAIESGETPGAQLVTDAADALNMMIKEWNTLGIHLWTEAEGILFLQANQAQYSLGTGSTDHATQTNPPNFVQTTLAANASASQGTITVTSSAGMLVNDQIGVLMNGGEMFWTTIANIAGTTISLAANTTDSSTAGNVVVDYTTAILRPLRVPAMRRYNLISQIETPMINMSRLDYRDLPNKTTTGTPTSYFYDPLGGANVAGQMYIWPIPSVVADAVKFTWYRQIQDFNNPGDNPDLPNEWINALVWNLAVQLAPEFDVPPQRYQLIKAQADESLNRVVGWDREESPIYFGVSIDYPQGRSSS
jgi:hypothetical protein